jgi:hypothetical protein
MRITRKDLEAVCERINHVTNSPTEPYARGGIGKYKSNIGCFVISGAYGGYQLQRICNEYGGVENVLRTGHLPAKDLYNRMQAFLTGLTL